MTSRAKSSHVASVLSVADILAVLYGRALTLDPSDPDWTDRDRFIISKGHAAAGVYAALAETGFFPVEWLDGFCLEGSPLAGHVSRHGVPGVEFSTGSLGHGLAVGCGMALAGARAGRQYRVFVLMSDGECDEGSNWEAALFASHHRLGTLTCIIDYNKLQSLGPVEETIRLEPLADKWKSFGWRVREVPGHDHSALLDAFTEKTSTDSQPTCVISHTVKGKGVSFMENSVLWHYRSPQGSEFEMAMKELEDRRKSPERVKVGEGNG